MSPSKASSARARLGAEDREFFSLVAESIFSNPFSESDVAMERLVGRVQARDSRAGHRHRFNAIAPLLAARVQRLERAGRADLRAYRDKDRERLGYAFLFQVYHGFIDALDALIQTQLRQGEAPVEVPFAEHLLAQLATRGFTEAEALRYLALFYQLRRAYYFIAHSVAGDSPCMRSLRQALWNNVFTHDVRIYDQHLWNRMEDFATLLLGETGTGKGTAAAAVGRSGLIPFDRKAGRFASSFTETFVSINLSQYPESLIESELFGHRKGAFTGAVDNYQGVFERCSRHGALFLDEIGEVSVPVQIKLLQVLQERRFSPVGSHAQKRFSGRVIAATNRSLEEVRGDNRMRDDFFYRLCSDVVIVPPLRQRIAEQPGELETLVGLLVERMTGEPSAELTGMVLETLGRDLPRDYAWPGNVRELEQAVRRVLLKRRYETGTGLHAATSEERFLDQFHGGTLDARSLLHHYCRLLYDRHGTYEEVARRTGLDRRTVKKHVRGEI